MFAVEELLIRRSFENFNTFFKLNAPSYPYLYGKHTKVLLKELDKTTKMLERGQSRYLIVNIPFRHGKSDICSRRWPAWHIMRNPDHEIIIGSYNFDIASNMSYDCRELVRKIGPQYDIDIREDRGGIGSWRINHHRGAVHAAGVRGGVTGKGANVYLIDDYYKNREEAESETIRRKVEHSFESDMSTRLAPVHAVVVVANRWHDDDFVSWLLRRGNPRDPEYDPDWPKFDLIKFAAEDTNEPDEEKRWLFPERFKPEWYRTAKAFMSAYAWNAQAQQDPVPREGNLFRVANVKIHDKDEDYPDVIYYRFWDLASTVKERTKDDPDYTVGTLLGVDFHPENKLVKRIWIKDVIFIREEAPKRDEIIREIAITDGPNVRVGIEGVAGYKDAAVTLKRVLSGVRSVIRVNVSGDKLVRAQPMEVVFERGNVNIVRGPWNDLWFKQLRAFPDGGTHDDAVDSMSGAFNMAVKYGGMTLGGLNRSMLGF